MARAVPIPESTWQRMAELDGHFDFHFARRQISTPRPHRSWSVMIRLVDGKTWDTLHFEGRDLAGLLVRALDEAESKWPRGCSRDSDYARLPDR